MQITVWDNVGQAQRARQVYSALYDAIDGKGNIAINGVGTIMSCYEVQPPQDLTDPETDWATVVSFYELFARS
jgi:fructose-1,6-bisphosphatase